MSDRVALGRVHAALVSLPGVRDAAVGLAGHGPDGRRIVAHVVTGTAPADLRAALAARLPAHLVPARLYRVPHIPLRADGSTDRPALAELTSPQTERGREPEPDPGSGRDPGSEPDPGSGRDPGSEPDPGSGRDPVPSCAPEPDPVPPRDPQQLPATVPTRPGESRHHPPGRPSGHPPDHPAPTPHPPPATLPLTPHQHTLLLDALAHPDPGRHVEQLHWRWRGPLDTERFTAAWQSVADRETVLRAAFDWENGPRLLLHEHAGIEVVRHPAGSVGFQHLGTRDRTRGFDLRRPALLRLNLLDERAPAGAGHHPGERVLLTFHHAMLDGWSVAVLLQEFYRAYLAGGRLPGGERRPDIRDYARWLARQDTAPARDFWSRAITPGTALVLPGVPGPATGLNGTGRSEARLGAAQAGRLRAWAASCAATEAGALQAAWALLLYRAADAAGPATVRFGVTVPGRGIALDSVERLPGLLTNTLPVTVRVDPAAPVTRLLAQLRDAALDIASYEWVSLGQVHRWSGCRADEELAQSVIAVEALRPGRDDLRSALAAQGISVTPPRPAGARTLFPVTLSAHRGTDDGLVLTAVHDRSRLADADASRLVGQCARLLRELPRLGGGTGGVAAALAALAGQPRVRMAQAPTAPASSEPTRGEPRP